MNHLEHCKGKHYSIDVSQCNELQKLPSLVADLSSVDETVRLKALYNILDEIGTAKIECCRASQFSSLLAQLYLLMRDFFKVEELEQIAEILELLSTKITVMTDEEANKFIYIFKAKQIGYLMKIKFLDPSIPKSVKESLAYSISAFGLIDDYYDFIFNPILKFLMEKLKIMEELLNKQPYKKELDPKRSKYGFRTLATILNALCIFTFGNYGLKSQIASHGGIEIGMRYMNHQSNKIRVIAATLFGLSSDKSIGIDFRTKNNFIDLLNKYIPQPHHIKVSSTHSHLISPRVRMKNLHSGLISGFGLCANCDIQIPSDQTDSTIDMKYRLVNNLLFDLQQFIINEHNTKNMIKIRITNLPSKVIQYLLHPSSSIRIQSLLIIKLIYEYEQKDWIINETKEIQLRKKIVKTEQNILQKAKLKLRKSEGNDESSEIISQCQPCALPIIFQLLHSQENDAVINESFNALAIFFQRLNTFRSEENQIRIQKTFTLMQQEKQDENEDAYFAQKRVIEDLEQEGLIETVQSMFFSTDERQTRTQSLFKTIIFQNY